MKKLKSWYDQNYWSNWKVGISPILDFLEKPSEATDKSVFYLVKVKRISNNNTTTIIYNYISYSKTLFYLIYSFLILKPCFKEWIVYREWGDFVCVFVNDNDLEVTDDKINYWNFRSHTSNKSAYPYYIAPWF